MKRPKPFNYKRDYKNFIDEMYASIDTDAHGHFVDFQSNQVTLPGLKKLHAWLGRAIKFIEKAKAGQVCPEGKRDE